MLLMVKPRMDSNKIEAQPLGDGAIAVIVEHSCENAALLPMVIYQRGEAEPVPSFSRSVDLPPGLVGSLAPCAARGAVQLQVWRKLLKSPSGFSGFQLDRHDETRRGRGLLVTHLLSRSSSEGLLL